ncbi:hemolysin family protein [Anaerovorax odorimutans]|uniref:Hemolysin family protein n=1 Tax=Anaerovorax odorimutans TaxID=109327 RepID=A0ABT1RL51_9FIRM|nr:hemolysin family protein [Anaerovorax odorimutans]MCQ4635897.1 hemolysin family protein [Anaerovorax odorimutans]
MSGSDPGSPLAVQFLFLFVLIIINAFFAAAEMAVVSVNKNKIKVLAQEGNKRALAVQKLLDNPNVFLSTIQVAITLAGFLASASAAVGMSDDLGTWLTGFGLSKTVANDLAVVIVTIILSYVTLVLGELFPKRIALQHSERVAMLVVRPINAIACISKPFVWFLSASVNVLLRIARQRVDMDDEEFSEDEVMSMLEVGQESGVLKEEGKKMINSIFAFDDKLAYEVMTPRTEVFSIDINDPTEEYIDELMELRYSRIPVYDDDSDKIIGILNIKDYLIKARDTGFENVDIAAILRKPYFVPETKNIDSLFFELQKTKQQIAILIDEYGGFSGIVTMEDIIEEVMGDIDDEYDEEEPEIEKIDENTYMLEGSTDLDDINEELEINLESENSETIGGFIIDMLGEIPDEDEDEDRIIEFENYIFKIESVKDRRIEKVKLYIMPEKEKEDPDEKEADEKESRREKRGKEKDTEK